jgi:hypothetical protein
VNISTASPFAAHALAHAQVLGSTPRGSTTPAERQASGYVLKKLQSLGVENVQLEPFTGLRSLWLFAALVLGVALVGHAAFWLLRSPAGDYPALIVSLLAFSLSGLLLWRKFTFREYPLRNSLPHGPSQNVVAVMPPSGEVQRQVVLVSHLDSNRAVFWFASDLLVTLFALTAPITLYGVYLAIPLYTLAVITHVNFFAWVGLALAFFHFLGWFTGITADLGRYSPGANDNASSVGTLLALAEQLKAEPLLHTELWLAFTGCEESGCDGLLSFIKKHGEALKRATFIDCEMVGIGDGVCYIREEGNIRRRRVPQDLESLLKEVGRPFALRPISTPPVGAFTEAGVLWEHGFNAVCLSACQGRSLLLPEWHRLTDTPSRLQLESFERIHILVMALLKRLDCDGA